MPNQSRSRDRYGQSQRERTRERERRGERRVEREREYIRGRYDEDEGEASSPGSGRKGKYRFRGEETGYDSYERDERRESDAAFEEEERRRRERRRRRREESMDKAKESPATSPIKKRDRERDRDGYRRRRELTEDEGSPTKAVRDRRHRNREGESDADAEARRQRRRERQRRERERELEADAAAAAATARKHKSTESTNSASGLLTADALAQRIAEDVSEHEMDEDLPEQWEQRHQERERSRNMDEERRERRQRKRAALAGAGAGALGAEFLEARSKQKSGARVVSGSYLEEGRRPDMNVRRRGGGGSGMEETWKQEESWEGSFDNAGRRPFWKFWDSWSRRKRIWFGTAAGLLILLAIIIPLAVVESQKKDTSSGSRSSSSSSTSSSSSNLTANLDTISRDSIPSWAQGTYLDPFTWYETIGFNLTFTNDTVGGLYMMGLNSSWDDSARPNDNVPPLNESFPYGSQPIRGVNIGGWLSIEPWITPSLFDTYSSDEGIIDEWTLTTQLGSDAATEIEKHYATFYTEQDFAEIAEAGLDHVRLQYSYWAVKIYDNDPYVPKIAWRYLLRAIEYCRKYGLRVNLDLHGVPGSQNGWEHSGHQGLIRWLNGTDGDLFANRSLEIHDQLTQFFAQDRYTNIVKMYGVANEPLMLDLSAAAVLEWTNSTTEIARKNGLNSTIVFHDGFLNLDKWDTMYSEHPDNMYLDTHQYTTFNTGEIVLNHTAKIELICNSWYPMIEAINVTGSGWGPTICGEWSQADTDCAKYLNNVGRGTRWEGTYDTSTSTQYCPTASEGTCSCDGANADVSDYSDAYKKWLLYYAEAQISVFETAMGWFYWTWRTESAAQWSYRAAWKAGFMPTLAYSPSFKCGDDVPDFSSLGLPEYY
ncbi:Exo-beta-1-3-glucanase [Penicillium malachiteum]|uniref:Exo-beta-1-3-glucanase n=1 Tax=Penicillium malachiteum TaxID=1324776 RepID=UPI002549A53C|nr:Exo-beta-1-3-glucanase [Penicillium malachiteum]KAJ5720438.1 Exo-beta-1-3-glucanase [Penicillium malachiteum]